MSKIEPTPGSDAAIARGCLCAIHDNSHGAGWLGSGLYWIEASCPLHGLAAEDTAVLRERAFEGQSR